MSVREERRAQETAAARTIITTIPQPSDDYGLPAMETIIEQLLPRYVRRYAHYLDAGLVCLRKIPWLPGFYALPGHSALSALNDNDSNYKDQGFFAMDAASSLAVVALQLQSLTTPCIVLDLCCCPGAKMQLIAENLPAHSRVIGVDNSINRLHVCRSLFDTWLMNTHTLIGEDNLARFYVFHADGRNFSVDNFGACVFDSDYILTEIKQGKTKNAMRNKSSRGREKQYLKLLEQSITPAAHTILPVTYDRVLVDAECTHDASYRHMAFCGQVAKWRKRGVCSDSPIESIQPSGGLTLSHNIERVEDITANKLELMELQRGLLANGFNSLSEGGVLVYSTCSHDDAQNEDIVQWLLDTQSNAMLDPIVIDETDQDRLIKSEMKQLVENALALCVLSDDVDANGSRKKRKVDVQQLFLTEGTRLCDLLSQLSAPPLLPSMKLPGTVRTSYEVGMSGHFIARIVKLPS